MERSESIICHPEDVYQLTLFHPWPYHYYVDHPSSSRSSDARLHSYMMSMFRQCPHHHFLDGPRSSSLHLDTGIELLKVKNHEVTRFASQGLSWNMQGTAHGDVQLFMLKHDEDTVGVEIPIWLEQHEYESLGLSFDKAGSLSGHIDVLRIEDGRIWVWDFKPNAHREKHADAQVLMYAMMLSFRTGIPLSRFRCGYFDENVSYIFDPCTSPLSRHLLTFQREI